MHHWQSRMKCQLLIASVMYWWNMHASWELGTCYNIRNSVSHEAEIFMLIHISSHCQGKRCNVCQHKAYKTRMFLIWHNDNKYSMYFHTDIKIHRFWHEYLYHFKFWCTVLTYEIWKGKWFFWIVYHWSYYFQLYMIFLWQWDYKIAIDVIVKVTDLHLLWNMKREMILLNCLSLVILFSIVYDIFVTMRLQNCNRRDCQSDWFTFIIHMFSPVAHG